MFCLLSQQEHLHQAYRNSLSETSGFSGLFCCYCFKIILIFLSNSILLSCLPSTKSRKSAPWKLFLTHCLLYSFSHPLLPSSRHGFTVCSPGVGVGPRTRTHHCLAKPRPRSPRTLCRLVLPGRGWAQRAQSSLSSYFLFPISFTNLSSMKNI